jgi:hypothetical protein
VEELENTNMKLTNDKKTHAKKIGQIEDKLKSIMTEKDNELLKVKSEQ